MSRILAIDYGKKRVGLAWTDPLQISINPLETRSPDEAIEFIKEVEPELGKIVLGLPLNAEGNDTNATGMIREYHNRIKNLLPEMEIVWVDESFTSREAIEFMIKFGYKKKDRKKKENVDKFAAAIILQRFMDSQY